MEFSWSEEDQAFRDRLRDVFEGATMSGGMRFEIVAPVYLGDVLTVEERLTSIEEKQGRSGPLVITITLAEYRNQSGALVARYQQTIIFR